MSKRQEVQFFAKAHGLTVKNHKTGLIIHAKIIWNGAKHEGWLAGFDSFDEAHGFFFQCAHNHNFPWKIAR